MLKVDLKSQKGDFHLDVRMDIPNGVSAVLGPSGSGKSSLLRLLAGLDDPAGGSLSLNGHIWFDELRKTNLDVRHRHIGMMFQHPRLLENLDVLGNVEIGARDEQAVDQVLSLTGVDKLIMRPVSTLSGGEKQRVMLARALAGKPKLILLDEPFSALDQISRHELMEKMAEILPTLGVPVILVTHAFDEAARLATQFVHLNRGKVVSSGSATEVLGGILPPVDLDNPLPSASLPVQAHEAATHSLLRATVDHLEDAGLAQLRIGGQRIDAPSGNFSVGDHVFLRLWARDVILSSLPARELSARNCLVGKVAHIEGLANGQVLVQVDVEGHKVGALVMARTAKDMKIEVGKPLFVIFKSTALDVSAVVEDL